jgi:outer membrane cobalamin receptor
LRGIGSSGASRTLVLWDGIPINDPFGGWVYWTRIPPGDLDRVEVSRAPSTSAFGDLAMGGVLGLYSRPAGQWHTEAGYQGGNLNSHEAFAGFSELGTRWAASAYGRAFDTDGYYIVPPAVRGAVDTPAAVRFTSGLARLDWFARETRVFLRFDLLAESRRNGTPLQNNSTSLGTLAGHYARQLGTNEMAVTAYYTRVGFRSTFSSIAANRISETLTMRQTVPSEGEGAAALWSRRSRRFHTLMGADADRVEGYSTDVFSPTVSRTGGGRLLQHGVFAQGDTALGPARLFAGLRHQFAGRSGNFLVPSAGIAAGHGSWRVSASVYDGFRAPTLNELYREFRAGNAVTLANPGLLPERMFGGQAGADYATRNLRFSLRAHRNSLDHLITNATVSSTPNLIVRQRRNVASAVARGFEAETRSRWRSWEGELAYLFADSRFASGARVPQVARHQGSARLTYHQGGTLVSAGVRSYSLQFEDELNRMLMPGFATLQVTLRQRLAEKVSANLAVENALDRIYITGFTPMPSIGAGRLFRLGIEYRR